MHQLVFRLFIVIILFINIEAYSKNNDSSKVNNHKLTIKIDSNNELTISTDKEILKENNSLSEAMPWITAAFGFVLTAIVNIYLGWRQRKSTAEALDRQLEYNKFALDKQFEYNKESLNIQFKSSIASKNRQEWINELRNSLSEFISKAAMISLSLQKGNNNEKEIRDDLDRLLFLKSKIELYINLEKPEQEKVRNCLWELIKILESPSLNIEKFGESQKKLILASRELFQIHWEKIKNLK